MALVEYLTKEFSLLTPEERLRIVSYRRQHRERAAETARNRKRRGEGGTKRTKRTTVKADKVTETLKMLKNLPADQREALLKELNLK